uniref:Ycf2 n=1 Tax=Botrychium ternatum TaxID=208695 RepID=A0A1B0PQE5_9MONI|nr:Ycf2 [Botrychium sp. ternatum/japonicum]
MRGKPIQTTSSVPPKTPNRRGISNIQSPFRFWTDSNVAGFSIGIFPNFGNILKLFDFQFLSSLILCDLRSSKSQNNTLLFKYSLLVTIPIILYRLNARALVETVNPDPAGLVNDSAGGSIVGREMVGEFDTNPLYPPKRILPAYNTVNSSVPGWWKDWIVRDILPSWKISPGLIDKVTVSSGTKSTDNLKNFFEFYIDGTPNREYATWRYDFDLCFVRTEKNPGIDWSSRGQGNILGNHLFPSVMVAFCEKILFEIEDPFNKQEYESNLDSTKKYPSRFWIHLRRYCGTDLSYQPIIYYMGYITDFWVRYKHRERCYNLIQDFVEFYSWAYYSNSYWIWQSYKEEFDIVRCIVRQRFIRFSEFGSSEHFVIVQSILPEILYNLSIHILSRIGASNLLKRSYVRGMGDIDPQISSDSVYEGNGAEAIPKDEDRKFSLSGGSISSNTNGFTRDSSHYGEFYPREWDWKQFLITIKSPTSIKYLNPGFYLSHTYPSIENGGESTGKGGIAKSLAETLFPIGGGIAKSDGSELFGSDAFKPLKHNHSDTSSMYGRFLISKSRSQLLRKQQYVSPKDSESSEIDRIVDLCRMRRYSHYPSSESCELIEDGFPLMKRIKSKDLSVHEPLLPPPNISYPFHSVFGGTGKISSPQNHLQFGELLATGMDRIDSFITVPNPASNGRLLRSIRGSNQVTLSKCGRVISNDSGIGSIEYSEEEILMNPAKDSSGIDAATSRGNRNRIFSLWNTVRDDTSSLWNGLRSGTNISSTSLLIKVCKHDGLVHLHSMHTMHVRKYLHLIPAEYLSKLKYRIDAWVGNVNYDYSAEYAIHQDLLIWRNSLDNQFGEFIVQTDQLYSDVRVILNRIQYSEPFPKYAFYRGECERLISDPDKLINNLLPSKRILGEYYSSKFLATSEAFKKIVETFEPFIYDSKGMVNRFTSLIGIPLKGFFYCKRNLLKDPQSRLNEGSIVPSAHYAIPANNLIFNFLRSEDITTESSYNPIFTGMDNRNNRFNRLNVRNNIPLKHSFDEVNTLSFLDSFHNPRFNHGERLYLSRRRVLIKGYNRIYMDIITNGVSKGSNKLFTFTRTETPSSKESNTSHIESQLSNGIILPGYLDPIPHETGNFLYRLYLVKEFMSLTRLELHHPEEPSMPIPRGIFMNRSPIMKRLVGIGISDYWRPFLELNHEESSILINGSFKDQFRRDGLSNGPISTQRDQNDSDHSRMVMSGKHKNPSKKLLNLIIGGEVVRPSPPTNSNEPWERISLYRIITENISLTKWILFKKYTLWFFTPEWWEYVNNSLSETFPEALLNINDRSRSNASYTVGSMDNSLTNSWSNLGYKLKAYLSNNRIPNFDFYPLGEITGQGRYSLSRWSLLGFTNDHSIPYLVFAILSSLVYSVSRQYLATLVGLNSISLWKCFEIIKYLIDFPQIIATGGSMDSTPSSGQNLMRNSLINYSRKFLNYLTRVSFYYLPRREINVWLSRGKNLDIPRKVKNLVVQYLITDKTLSRYVFHSNHGFDSSSGSINRSIGKQGFNHLRYLTSICQKNLSNYQIRRFDSVEKLILSAFRQNLNSPEIFGQFSLSVNTPIPLQLGSFPGRGISLIGPTETGRSYLVKNLAANYRFPSIQVPINRFLQNKPDFGNTPVALLPKKCLRRLDLTFELARRMSPCTIWIRDIHELNFNHAVDESEVDPKFLLHSLLKHISNRSPNYYLVDNIVIASTHAPARVDPAIITPDRLDQLINIRTLNTHQRGKEFPALLRAKGFHLEVDSSHSEGFRSRTMGYSKRDLAVLANETLSIGIAQKTPLVRTEIIRLALYRQGWALDNKSQAIPGYEMLVYRVGKAIIRNSLINTSYMDFSFINNNLLKKRFYFLSNWYLEPPIAKSTMKEFTMLPHILGCLAGAAARDSWFVSENKQENSVSIDRIVENDLQLARGISESMLVEFPQSGVRGGELNKGAIRSSTRGCSGTIRGYVSSRFSDNSRVLDEKPKNENTLSFDANGPFEEIPRNSARAPRVWRISFLRSSTYGFVRVPSEPDPLYNSMILYQNRDHLTRGNFHFTRIKRSRNGISKRREGFFGYRRILKDTREKYIHTPEVQLENVSFRERLVKLGIDKSSIQYEVQYDSSNQPIISRGGRFVWNPTGSSPPESNSTSSCDGLFPGEETVRRLYITYGIRRERERQFPSNKYKKHLFHRGYNRDSVTESFADLWDEFHPAEKRHFEYVRVNQMMKSHLLTPQLFPAVYPYQSLFLEDAQNGCDHFNFSNHRYGWIEANRSSSRDSTIYTMLSESYQYLLNLSLSNEIVLSRVMNTLSKNKLILPGEIEEILLDLE